METIKTTIDALCKADGISQAKIARLTEQHPQSLNKKLITESMRYRDAQEIADKLGYTIIWQKKS